MSEAEWRHMGIQQSRGWVHYMIHSPGIKYKLLDVFLKRKKNNLPHVIRFIFFRAPHFAFQTTNC